MKYRPGRCPARRIPVTVWGLMPFRLWAPVSGSSLKQVIRPDPSGPAAGGAATSFPKMKQGAQNATPAVKIFRTE